MPTVMTHAVVGAAAALAAGRQAGAMRFWMVCLGLSMLPDLDVLAFSLGIPYAHWLGHRGAVHSLAFSLLSGSAAALLGRPGGAALPWMGFFSLLAASHPLLDALTDGGLGVALLWPLSGRRFFFPVTPIQVAPIGVGHFLSGRGLRVLANEARWVWLPCAALVLAARAARRLMCGSW